jgi:hypothetical protein
MKETKHTNTNAPLQKMPEPKSEPNSLGLPERKGTGKKILLIATTIIITALIVGGGTWYYMNKKAQNQKNDFQNQINQLNQKIQDNQKQTSSTSSASTKSYTSKYEKVKFEYPDTFILTDLSKAEPASSSGIDTIKLSNGNFVLTLQAGLYGIGGACESCKVLYSEPITVLGKNLYLNYVSNDGGPKVDIVVVAKTPTDTFGFFEDKNITIDGNKALMGINLQYKNGEKSVPKTVQELKTDTNVLAAKQVIQSMSY